MPDEQQKPDVPETADGAGAAAAADKPEKNGTAEKTFTQAELDAIIAKRLDQQKRQAQKDAEAEAEKKLAEAAEWQTLAEKRAGAVKDLEVKLAELERVQVTAEKYGAALTTYVEKLSANLPEPILALLENMDAADKLAWLSANAEQFAAANGNGEAAETTTAAAKTKLPPTPKPSGSTQITPEERRKRAARTF
ncbi:MAG: hypothetical protein H6661_10125 [Ardenticatenaceae bacterium]|nr:hypothetical protein [Ardenticatenaceae bacterium]